MVHQSKGHLNGSGRSLKGCVRCVLFGGGLRVELLESISLLSIITIVTAVIINTIIISITIILIIIIILSCFVGHLKGLLEHFTLISGGLLGQLVFPQEFHGRSKQKRETASTFIRFFRVLTEISSRTSPMTHVTRVFHVIKSPFVKTVNF